MLTQGIEAFRTWLRRPGSAFFAALLLLNGFLSLFTAAVTLQKFPNAGDEYAALVSAECFARGRLSVPSPEPREFFDHFHVLNNGRFYGKYPPGWSMVLVPGVLLGVPWLVNPVLAVGTLILFRAIARRHFGESAAVYALVTVAVNPFFLMNSGSHFSHSSCLFFITLCVYGIFNMLEKPGSVRDALCVGCGAGMAFLIRPFSAVLMLAPLALFLLYRSWKRGLDAASLKGVLVAVGSSLVFLGIFFGYNAALTGHPLAQPFTQYWSGDAPSLPKGAGHWWWSMKKYSLARLWAMNWPWMPLCLVALAFSVVDFELRRNVKIRLLWASLAVLVVGYGFYPADGGIGYGPRYAYELIVVFALLFGAAYARIPKAAPVLASLILAWNLYFFASYAGKMEDVIRGKREIFARAEAEALNNAIVFMRTGSGFAHPGDLARNGIDFDGPVLFVRDLKHRNTELMKALPERTPYYFVYDKLKGVGSFIPFDDPRVELFEPPPPPQVEERY